MSIPLSRASETTLRIGALSGETMAIILAAETIFPKPTLTIRMLNQKPPDYFSRNLASKASFCLLPRPWTLRDSSIPTSSMIFSAFTLPTLGRDFRR